ncbi:MAG TPA: ABC transporter permease [Euzebyales bacterium]|nr:ABC transporter permease [Euzebyales bacterium]
MLRKGLWALVTVLVVITFNFVLFRVLPGDPAKSGMRDPRLNPEAVAALEARFGLDQPVFLNPDSVGDTQFFAYWRELARGNLGTSYEFRNQSVASVVSRALANTLWLLAGAQILAIVLGMGLGLLAAWRRQTRIDVGALLFALLMWSLPTFFLGILLLFIGSSWFGLPTGGRFTVGATYATWGEYLADLGRHLLLPSLTFTLALLAQYMLIMRSTVIEVFSEDYILTAKAKGLSTWAIITRHALRNAMLPMATLIALNLGFTVSGAIEVETVFSLPGIGLLTVNAVNSRDYPVLQGAFLLLAVSVVLANLAADLVYGWLDPRVGET